MFPRGCSGIPTVHRGETKLCLFSKNSIPWKEMGHLYLPHLKTMIIAGSMVIHPEKVGKDK
jgi:hypothetical protein